MADVYVTMGAVGALGAKGASVAVFAGKNLRTEIITSGASTAAGSLVARMHQVAKVHCETPIYANAGASPTVSATTGVYIAAGETEYIALDAGESIAVIDA